MRRSDRLFELIQILRDGRLHRAADLAEAMGRVSVRTIWRDMATLMASGMPIEGERGVGYILRAPTTLPPILLAAHEMEALRQGLRMVAMGDDLTLARAARSLASKVGAVSPAPIEAGVDDLFAFTTKANSPPPRHLPSLRAAIAAGSTLVLTYLDDDDTENTLTIRPLSLDLAEQWLLNAICLPSEEHRSLSLNRITALTGTNTTTKP